MDDFQNIYVYELPTHQKNDSFWISYKIRRNEKISFSKILSNFLQDYKDSRKKEIDPKTAKLYFISNKHANNLILIENLNNALSPFTNSEFCVSFLPVEEEKIYAKQEISSQFYEQGLKFKKKKEYFTATNFFQYVENYGLTEIAKICYIVKEYDQFKEIIDKAIENTPNDLELLKFASNYFEEIGEIQRSYNICKKFVSKSPVFNLSYHRLCLTDEKVSYVNKLVDDALHDPKVSTNDEEIILECVKLHAKNRQLDKICELCCLNFDFLINCVELFCSIPSMTKVYRTFLSGLNIPCTAKSLIGRKMIKHRDGINAIKLGESLFLSNRYNFFCALTYIDYLLQCYEYDKLVDVITLFFTFLPKQVGKFDIEKIASILQSSSTFRTKTFNPMQNPDFDYCDLEFENDDDLDTRINRNLPGSTRIKHPDFNKIYSELCSSENMLCFEVIIMCISVFFFIIGDIATYKNIIAKLGNLIDYESTTIPHQFKEIQKMYQSAYIMKNSAFPLMSNSHNMLAVGDAHCLSCCNTKVIIQNKTYYITSLPIQNLSIYDLRPESKHFRKELFFRFMRKADQFKKVMVFIGTKDCEVIIPKLIKKKMFFSQNPALDAIVYIVDVFLNVLDEIKRSMPRSNIIVHCALPRFYWSAPIVDKFNMELSKKLKGRFSFVAPFQQRSNDNIFQVSGFADGVPDARYSINLNTALNKMSTC